MPSLIKAVDAALTQATPYADELELFRDVLNAAGLIWGGERTTGGKSDVAMMIDDVRDSWSDYRTVVQKDLGTMYRTLKSGDILSFVRKVGEETQAHTVLVYSVDKTAGTITVLDNGGDSGAPQLFELPTVDIIGSVQVQSFNNSASERLYGDLKGRMENYIDGGDGNDTIDGGLGNDTLLGGSGNDSLIGGYGDDSLVGGFGNDTLIATAGNDVLVGGTGLDRLVAGAGKDRFVFEKVTDTRLSTALTFNSMDMLIGVNFGGDGVGAADTIELPFTVNSVVAKGVTKAEGISFYAAMNYLFAKGQPLYETQKAGLFSYQGEIYLVASGPSRSNNLGADDFILRLQGVSGLLDSGDFGYSFVETDPVTGRRVVKTTTTVFDMQTGQDDMQFLGTTNFRGTGNALDNSITGGVGNDTLDGGVGNDSLVGGTGNDTYVIDSDNDVITEGAGEGTDSVRTSLTTYVLADDLENLEFTTTSASSGTGNAANNSITGGTGDDTLTGLAGNDTLDGGLGVDSLLGGVGNDTYVVDNAADTIVELVGEGTDTVKSKLGAFTLANNLENLSFIGVGDFAGTGNAVDNSITGGTGNDTLEGAAGNDTLDGGVGVDSLIGGAGNDTYVINQGADVIVEVAGEGTDTVSTTLAAYTLSSNVENLTYLGTAVFAGTGSADNNSITGGAGADTLSGLAGDDTLDGAAGIDSLAGGLGNDTYVVDSASDKVVELAGEGTDTVRTALASLTLAANVENLVYTDTANFTGTGNALANSITGAAGSDLLSGGADVDTLTGAAGDDTLDGGAGADSLTGGVGDDTYVVDDAGDTIVEAAGEGSDTVSTSLATFTLGANLENLTFTGTAAATGTGNADANALTGGAGADTLNGAGGSDTLTGGAGADNFVIATTADSPLAGPDQITDFSTADGDKVDLSGIDANTATAADDAFTFVGNAAFTNVAGELRWEVAGTAIRVLGDINGDGTADFAVVLAATASITATDFVL